tara:strand:+ start:4429 stop:4866 length:438 start_codon:yes stop_codon:yes gene_type:complete
MNLQNFVDGLNITEREELLDILTGRMNESTTMPPHIVEEFEQEEEEEEEVEQPQRTQEDFTMHKDKPSALKSSRRREPVKGGENTWTDTGEHKEVQTPKNAQRTPRNRTAPKKKNVKCHICGKNSKVNANIVYGEYYRCDRCTGR